MQWCGLKYVDVRLKLDMAFVTTDAVVWIEIILIPRQRLCHTVTTDAVVWIEMIDLDFQRCRLYVTTDAVVWIEISILSC